jgi:hypothetical protein
MSFLNRLLKRICGQSRLYRTRRRRPVSPFGVLAAHVETLEVRALLSSTFVVDSITDTGTGSGLTGDIRYCIAQANQSANAGSTITFSAALTGSTITLSQGELVISDAMTITGPGASSLTISGNNSSRLFDVASGGSLTLENVTLTGGLAQGTGAAAEGGAIYSSGTLALSGVTVTSNEALGSNGAAAGLPGDAGGNGADACGGGIYVAGGTVTLSNDTLSSNKAVGGNGGAGATSSGVPFGPGGNGGAGSGGGLYVASGSVTLTNNTLSSNNAMGGNGGAGGNNGTATTSSGVLTYDYGNGGAGSGGGLYLAGGTVTLTNSTLSSNQAVGGSGGPGGFAGFTRGGAGGNGGAGLGGGLYLASGGVTMTNDTLSSNNAVGGTGGPGGPAPISPYGFRGTAGADGSAGAGSGGGFYVAYANVTLNDDTLSSNDASGSDGAFGGGIGVLTGTNVLLHNTLVAANLANGNPSDVYSDNQVSLNTASSYNLIGDGDGGLSTANHNLLGSSTSPLNPLLGPLQNNGGPTQTTALLAGSPAIDAGDNTNAPAYDQRGPGFARIVNGTIDIGAFEVQNISATQAGSLTVRGFPSSIQAGASGSFTVTAENADGTTNTSYAGTVRFSSSDAKAMLVDPATGNAVTLQGFTYTFTAADAGVHTFSATLKTAGTQSIRAADMQTPAISGTEGSIQVNPAAASTMTVTGFPSTTTAGVAGNVTVTLKDPYGNIASGYTGTVHFTSTDGKATLPANYTFAAADAGAHTFSVTLKKAGTQSISTADTLMSALEATETGITVNAGAASQFIISAPSSLKSGVPFSLTLRVEDAYGNVVGGYTGTVHFTSTDSRATLPANYTFTATDKGVHTFTGMVLRKKGTQKITVTDTLNSLLTASETENVQ